MDGNTIYQGADQGGGTYSGFMYFRRPSPVTFPSGATLYVEVDYKDIGGPGKMGIQYNAVGNAFATCSVVLNSSVANTGAYKTAVMRLDNSDLQYLQNGGNDLRLTHTQDLRFHVKEMRVSDTPSAAYLAATDFLGPYTGPAYNQGIPVDASTFNNKLVCGYQGWFRAPGDDDDIGWQHWTGSWGNLDPGLISEDFWPDMTEYLAGEKFVAPGFSYPGGAQAHLFSSDDYRTVLRHFQWMEAHGIDGAALQRFTNWGSGGPGLDSFRVMAHVREAANRTGRVWFVEYDMTGTNEADLVAAIQSDWHYLVDTMKVDEDVRYLHDGGRPVVAIHGFYRERFSVATANAIVDIFRGGGAYDAYLLASGEWYWDQQMPSNPAWNDVIYRMDAWLGWNAGNLVNNPPMAKTDYWNNNRTLLATQGVKFVPELFPGASSYHRDGQEIPALPSAQFCPRRNGDFYWEQFAAVRNLNFTTVFLGMFDEYDEGTQIAKALPIASAPTQRTWLDYEGQPSDCYLCYTGQGARMMKGQIPYQATKPNCPGMTQPSIPESISPTENGNAAGPNVTFNWGQSYPAAGSSAAVTLYELDVDGVVSTTTSLSALRSLSSGGHTWRVRALNSLGNYSGWSLKLPFTVTGSPITATRTPTPSATPSASATKTPVPASGCAIQVEDYTAYFDTTAGNSGGQYRAEDVDIEATADAGGGYNVGFTDNGEWLEFNITVASTGDHDITLRHASNNASGGTAQLMLDGASLGPAVDLPNTGGWQAWQSTVVPGLPITAGLRRLRLLIVAGGSNYNYLCVNPAATPTPSPTATRTTTRTATPSRTSSLTSSSTASRTATRTATQTSSPTSSVTPAATRTATPTLTRTPTSTGTSASTSTPSSTPTVTPVATRTATATSTGTLVSTAASSSTPTSSRTATPTSTRTPTSTGTPASTATSSVTLAATRTTTPTLTRTPMSTGTATSTGTPTLTASPSLTRTPTTSLTGTATSSVTPGSSPTPTATSSRTPTGTVTRTPSATASPSVTPTASCTSSPSATPSSSPTVTPNTTASPTVTAALSASPSATPTNPPTATTSVTPAATRTPTLTSSATATRTPSSSATVTPTGSISPSPTATSSRTVTAQATPSATVTPSSTATPSSSPSPTGTTSATASATATASVSPTPTASATVTPSTTPSPTPSATDTPSGTPFSSPSATRTGSPTANPTATRTSVGPGTATTTPVSTVSPTASGSPTAAVPPASAPTAVDAPSDDADPEVQGHGPWPNPGPASVAVKLRGRADALVLRVYTRAMACVAVVELPNPRPGWNQVALPAALRQGGWGAGVFHYSVRARRGVRDFQDVVGTLVVLR